ncbi:MAG: dihydrofolate reductase [Proteobacteria bacterium]|nr:dihydrofolate reductase [Pseudomonadota bacterium]
MDNPAPVPTLPRITLIAAVARNRVIGQNNAMPWRLPEDLKRFKALTLGHPVIMGRKTWDSLGRPLPGRLNIVISRSAKLAVPGAQRVDSLPGALSAAAASGANEAYVIGGAEIYQQALPLADCLQLTEIDRDFAGDAFFPEFAAADWRETRRESHHAEAGFDYAFVTYEPV